MKTIQELFDEGTRRSNGVFRRIDYINARRECCFVGALALGAGFPERPAVPPPIRYREVFEAIGKELGIPRVDVQLFTISNGKSFEDAFDGGESAEELIPQYQACVDKWRAQND